MPDEKDPPNGSDPSIQEQLNSAKSRYDSLHREMAELIDKLNSKASMIELYRVRIRGLVLFKDAKVKECARTQKNIEEYKEQLEDQKKKSEDELREKDKAFCKKEQTLQEEIAELGEQIGGSENQRNELLGTVKELEERVRVFEKEIEKQEKQVENLTRQLTATNQELENITAEAEEMRDRLEKIQKPPTSYAIFIEMNPDKSVAVFSRHGTILRLSVDPRIADSLVQGDVVIVNEQIFAVVDKCDSPPHRLFGRQCTFVGYQSENIVIVKGEDDRKTTAFVPPWIDRSKIGSGTSILVFEGMVTELLNTESIEKERRGFSTQFMLAEMPDVNPEDIGGLDKEIAEIMDELYDPIYLPNLCDGYGIKGGHFILFGVPGVGKTLIAKLIARKSFELHKDAILEYAPGNFFAINGTKFLQKYVGTGEELMEDLFVSAQSLHDLTGAPQFIFIDDCESVFATRGSIDSAHYKDDLVTTFTSLTEGIRELRGITIILATNRIDRVDGAVLGRMNMQIRIPAPITKERAHPVFRSHLRTIPVHTSYLDKAKYPNLKGNREKALDFILDKTIKNLFEKSSERRYARVHIGLKRKKTLYFFDMLSGRLIRDIVGSARRIAKNRDKNENDGKDGKPSGLLVEDMAIAIDKRFEGSEGLPGTDESIAEFLRQQGEGIANERIDVKRLQKGKRTVGEEDDEDSSNMA